MLSLLFVGLAAGVITSISPCVLPVLPVVLTAGASGTGDADVRRSSWRPVRVVIGLVLSFCLATLLGSLLLSALGLPDDLLRDIGIAVLAVIGLSLLVPRLGELVERPFARVSALRPVRSKGNGLVLGLSLGLLYVPCAGPVLATIAVVGATHHLSWRAVALTAAFGVGAGVPLLVFALAGDAVTRRVAAARRRAPMLRLASGALMIALAVAITFNLTDGLQRALPGYTSAFQNGVERGSGVDRQLADVADGGGAGAPATRAAAPGDLGGTCHDGDDVPENCGRAPAFTGIDSWLNTSHDKPLSLRSLRGKVVLVDFWTYSCINCQRTLPHVEAWYREYAKQGLVVIGVHTPEFAFEHVRSNVEQQAAALGVQYPIAIDNEYRTWNAYHNQYWPAEYLIDANGNIRHEAFGEGSYSATESLIRQLLKQAKPHTTLGALTDVPSANLDDIQTPETYLGSEYPPLHSTSGVTVQDGTHTYRYPGHLDPDGFALDGTWTEHAQYLAAGRPSARLELSYAASTVYLVLGGTGTVQVSVDGRPVRTVDVHGVPTLYTLVSAPAGAKVHRHVLQIRASAGVQAYDFTFG